MGHRELPMAERAQLDSSIDQTVDRILAWAPKQGAGQLQAWRKPRIDLRRMVSRDYVRPLRKHLGYREVKRLVDTAESMLTRLGHPQSASAHPPQALRRVASRLRVHLKAKPFEGPEGMALRGFYVDEREGMLKRPLIYLNTAHVPLAVSVTFIHEFGHHVAAGLFNTHREQVHFYFDADYAGHLDDPAELAADVIVSFRGYPAALARKIFKTSWDWGLVARAGGLNGEMFGQIRAHIRDFYGFDFSPSVSARQNLHYLSGMIHYAKLRWALLAEYGL
jgi:hypothetical protein